MVKVNNLEYGSLELISKLLESRWEWGGGLIIGDFFDPVFEISILDPCFRNGTIQKYNFNYKSAPCIMVSFFFQILFG